MDQESGVPQPVGQAPVSTVVSGVTKGPQAAATALAPVPAAVSGQLRYAAEIKRLTCCPPTDAQALNIVGFRFAFEDLEHRDNYLPLAKITPERAIAGQPVTECCTGYSLSVFNSLDALASRARKVLKTSPQFLRRVGDHFVQLKITAEAGICTAPNNSGHFDLFELDTFSCRGAVLVHERLPL
ncbi:hypothetical protein [Burkholderia pseudomallei]|uniref:hypothetical protein n=1 Tax=Burkholderia pseudomallei TaxID=28450 RepID=UPI001AAFA159|nr:hypothetical protein [Burkholderia pseudomallei]MBO2977506.1 hypothetical protein [Burkholderia pseudomallei]MBO3047287.1 hypothetical protein [Burkholderia pseudomallei]